MADLLPDTAEEEGPTPPAPSEGAGVRDWVLAIDFESPATSKTGAWFRVVFTIASLIVFFVVLRSTTAAMMVRQGGAPLNGDTYEGHRFGLQLHVRKAIFADLAAVEIAERKRAITANTWQSPTGTHYWSREDDRGHYEMTAALRLSKQYAVSLTHVYMILDEGIREKWPGPNGEPLIATTPPQDPRSTW